ncbi:glycosyltransferase family 4 protein [Thomasclavelia cocleata]|jgi:glycosyltransferase involved in cell wall biosynthesis|uniref:glycosyltransferase family 4 protein n=1 Tax=Thomasclavelia cocleata TaxID=69824 RepID=UPI00241F89DB|nr:glycosyltransferase family 4 protein [Thomasclavelia cocleata]
MRNILILMGRYLPGYKDGGPVRTIVNVTNILGDKYNFYIMTSDRDHGDTKPYKEVRINKWNKVNKANVFYLKDGKFRFKDLIRESKQVDLIYCCGPYDKYAVKIMLLKRFHIIKKTLVIASMGSFSSGALAIKAEKKIIFIKVLKFMGLFKNIIWSVTSRVEENELKAVIGQNAECMIAEDLPRNIDVKHLHQKKKNELKIIFLSRICEKKNLLFTIQILKKINKNIVFDIYGNMEDPIYWKKCENELKDSSIKWHYMGECDSESVPETFAEYDVFLFPTLGENFGHVIGEALAAGCIPIISDTTPWLDFDENKCGKVIPLESMNEFINAINDFIIMDQEEFIVYINNAQNYINTKNQKSIKNTGYMEIFEL